MNHAHAHAEWSTSTVEFRPANGTLALYLSEDMDAPVHDLALAALIDVEVQSNPALYTMREEAKEYLYDECDWREFKFEKFGPDGFSRLSTHVSRIADKCYESWNEYMTQSERARDMRARYEDAKHFRLPELQGGRYVTKDDFARALESQRAYMGLYWERYVEARSRRDEAKQRALALLTELDALSIETLPYSG